MREVTFRKQNEDRWKKMEAMLATPSKINPDEMSGLYIQLTDDLSYARTFYPESPTTSFLNHLSGQVHQRLFKTKKQTFKNVVRFWVHGLPSIMAHRRKELAISFVIFFISAVIGVFSASRDERFVRVIMGDDYVNRTLENINKGKPMAVYDSMGEGEMFFMITLNNIRVSFFAFAAGVFASFGTGYLLFSNGVMLGAFQYFFYQKGYLLDSVLSIWVHGVPEISAIIIAGAAGLVLGNSLLFPGTFTRLESFRQGARDGSRIITGLIPVFIIAGFLESFVTRHANIVPLASACIILTTSGLVIWYFVIYPHKFTHLNIENHVRNQP
ncbi:MAG: stage II sporulation protein M [Flavobacteriales bacterium]|nr:stage II sporulation protein M [Flavobacteriales bacterium]